jgi:hypothetical protein
VELPELTYTGKDQELVNITAEGGKVSYRTTGPLWVSSVPTGKNAGDYAFCYKVEGDSNHNDIEKTELFNTIGFADPEITKAPEAVTAVYDGELHELVKAGSSPDGEFNYSLDGDDYSTDIPCASEAGEYTIYCMLVGDSNHKDLGPEVLTSYIADKNDIAAFTREPEAVSFVYDGQPHQLVIPGTTDDGTILYRVDIETEKYDYMFDEDELHTAWSEEIPEATLDATYTVSFRIVGDGSHVDSPESSVVSVIEPAQFILEAPEQYYTYDGEPHGEPITAVTADGRDALIMYFYGGNFGFEAPQYTDVKSSGLISKEEGYKVEYIVDLGGHQSVEGEYYIYIEKADPVVTVELPELTYDGDDQKLVNITAEGGKVSYKTTGPLWVSSVPTGKNAGDYCFYYKVEGDSNHNDIGKTELFNTIGFADPEITERPEAVTVVFDGEMHELVKAGSSPDGEFNYSLDGDDYSADIPCASKPGEYTVYCMLVGDSNHKDLGPEVLTSYIAGEAEIAAFTREPEAVSFVYDGQPHQLVIPGATDDGTILYRLDIDTENYGFMFDDDELHTAWSEEIPEGTLDATYTVSYRIAGDNSHVDSAVSSVVSVITPAQLTVEASDQYYTYDGEPHGDPISVTPVAGGDPFVAYFYGDDLNVGEAPQYTDVRSGGDEGYKVTYVAGLLGHEPVEGEYYIYIQKADPVVTVELPELTYNGEDQKLVNITAEGGKVSYMTTGPLWVSKVPTGRKAGDYTFYYKVEGDSNHNSIGKTELTNTIAPIDGTVIEAPDQSYVYDGGMHGEPVTAATPDGKLTVRYGTEEGVYPSKKAPQIENVSESTTVYYEVTLPGEEPVRGSYLLEITKAVPVIHGTEYAEELVYDGDPHYLGGLIWSDGGQVLFRFDGDEEFTEDTLQATNAGEYKIWYYCKGDENFLDTEPQCLTVVIAKADPAVTVELPKLTYNGEEQSLVKITAEGGKVSYMTTGPLWVSKVPTGRKAGEYTFYYKVTGDENHNDIGKTELTNTIDAIDGLLIEAPDQSYTYDGTDHGEEVTALSPDGSKTTVRYGSAEGEYTTRKAPRIRNVSESTTVYYEVTVKGQEPVCGSYVLEITKAVPEINGAEAAEGLVYDGQPHSLVGNIWSEGGQILMKLDVGEEFSSETPQAADAGEYKVWYYCKGDENHLDTEPQSLTAVIAKADPAVTVELPELTYTGKEQELVSITAEGGKVSFMTTGPFWVSKVPTGKKAGEYTFYYKVTGDSNHNDIPKTQLTNVIGSASGDTGISAPDQSYEYDGKPHGEAVTVSGNATVKYAM